MKKNEKKYFVNAGFFSRLVAVAPSIAVASIKSKFIYLFSLSQMDFLCKYD